MRLCLHRAISQYKRESRNFPTRRHYFSGSNFLIGRRKRETEFGSYPIYDVERSICDMRRLEPQITL